MSESDSLLRSSHNDNITNNSNNMLIDNENDSIVSFSISDESIEENYRYSNKYFCFCIPTHFIFSSSNSISNEKVHDVKNTPLQTIPLLLNSMIGSGILAQAYVFSNAGWLSTIIQYIIVGYLTFTGSTILIHASDELKTYSYGDIANKAFGEKYGKYIIEISIIINNFGGLLSYVIIIGSLLQSILNQRISPNVWYGSIGFSTILPMALFVAPLCLVRNFGHLVGVAYFSILAIISVVFVVCIGGPILSDIHGEHLIAISIHGTMKCLGSVVFAFGYASAIFHSYNAMSPKKPQVFNNMALITTLIGIFMCFIIGLIGGWAFEHETKADILENFTGVIGTIFKLIVITHLICYIPGDYVIMRSSILNLFDMTINSLSDIYYITGTLGSIALITCLACLLLYQQGSTDAISFVIDLTGGITGSITNFIVPGFIGMKILWNDDDLKYKSIIVFCCGCCIPILVIIGTLSN